MTNVLTLQWDSPTGKLSEDVFLADQQRGVFAVADGVTRRGYTGAYPQPSPARLAAEHVVRKLGTLLPHLTTNDEAAVEKVWHSANNRVRQLNQELGFWDNHDYWGNDYAGAVASCLLLTHDFFLYGFIGDCGVAQLSATGEILWRTPNEVHHIEPLVLPDEAAKHTDQLFKWRKEYRNNPQANHPTYGVLTGEAAALKYVRTGRRSYRAGEILILYSDGIEPFLYQDSTFRSLIVDGNQQKLTQYIAARSSPDENKDEKTLIVIKTAAL